MLQGIKLMLLWLMVASGVFFGLSLLPKIVLQVLGIAIVLGMCVLTVRGVTLREYMHGVGLPRIPKRK